MKIVPSIIAQDFYDIEEKIRPIEDLVEWVQIDVSDNVFAKPASWPYTEVDLEQAISELSNWQFGPKLELHLMISKPDQTLDEWINTDAGRIFVHYESMKDPLTDMAILNMSKTISGASFLIDTPLDVLSAMEDQINAVLLMSISDIGHYGATFDERVFDRIKEVKNLLPKATISIDGGVNEHNIKRLKDAGVDFAVIGSAIFSSDDPRDALQYLQSLV